LLSGEVAATLRQVWQLQLIALTILDSMLSNGLGSSLSNNRRSSAVLPFAFQLVRFVASLLLFLELVYIQCLAWFISFRPFGLHSDDV
jgi:hypothetical protein